MTTPPPLDAHRVARLVATVLGRLGSAVGQRLSSLMCGPRGGGRRLLHGLDASLLGLLMEVVVRVIERKLLTLAGHPSPDGAAHDQGSSAVEPPAA
jgi:hypothetical protein